MKQSMFQKVIIMLYLYDNNKKFQYINQMITYTRVEWWQK